MQVIQKVRSLETSNFWLPPPLFVPVLFACNLPLPSPRLRKKFHDAYKFYKRKIQKWKEIKELTFLYTQHKR